ncbi:bifunctional 2-polyprenyl-6-hydroxyphenol methylase/3-demethylubiquinol 3-O-methyltransferase UbiG [Flavobacterium sp. K5-23]|uniref:class I SAM-dependent methyltransferase n=1 Tax=Flavobacterium sp. K5-23 TaxID=2746225 RepID=UPI00200DE495|nr:class I SAM-dependent methyltransferase [Flavobacterium sp. K5-23]UQD56167.1 class I SAM-dependent methyltransferase [Flavobacterium sp. K5-23]
MNKYIVCKVCKSEVILINETYNLGQCKNCQLIFCLTIYSQKEFVTIYDELYNDEDAVYSNHSVLEYEMLLKNKKIKVGHHRSRLLKKHVLNGICESVLEIGSGIGLIGSYIRNKNKKIKYLGIEIDKESYQKSQFLKLNTINDDFTTIKTIEESFDVIMLWEVIEHLQDLKLFIELAYEKLNKNGKIILSTPNYNKIYNYPEREKDALFQDKPPVHLNFFTKENICTIFEINHFVNCKARVKKFPYFDIKSKNFYIDFIKSIFNKYNGSTLYFVGTKA